MNTQKNVGDIFAISIIRGSGGGIRSQNKVNGCYCYVRRDGVEVEEGDLCLVRFLGQNKRGSMSHVEVLQFLDSADGTHHVLSQFPPHFSKAIRQAERHLSRMRKHWAKAPHMLGQHLVGVAEGPNSDYPGQLPAKYVRDRLAAGLAITQDAYGEKNPVHLPHRDKLADLELELGNVDAAKTLLERSFVIAGLFGHTDYLDKTGIKLARIHYSQKRYGKAAELYRLCSDVESLPVKDRRQLADAYTQIGDHDLAYGVLNRLTEDLMAELKSAQSPMFAVIEFPSALDMLGGDMPPAVAALLGNLFGGNKK